MSSFLRLTLMATSQGVAMLTSFRLAGSQIRAFATALQTVDRPTKTKGPHESRAGASSFHVFPKILERGIEVGGAIQKERSFAVPGWLGQFVRGGRVRITTGSP